LIAYAPRLPGPGETILGSKYETGCGGKGANQCVAAANLLAEGCVKMVGAVGRDGNGQMFVDALKGKSVDCSDLYMLEGETTGVAPITVSEATGENQIVVIPGANLKLELSKEVCGKLIDEAHIMICQNEISLSTTEAALALAKEHNIYSIFNPSPKEGVTFETLRAGVNCLIVNEHEAASFPDPFTKVPCLQLLIVTYGPDGAVVTARTGSSIKVPVSRKVGKVVDTTGAGDAFLGAFAAALYKLGLQSAHDATFEQYVGCVEKANEIASMSVEAKGTQSSYPVGVWD